MKNRMVIIALVLGAAVVNARALQAPPQSSIILPGEPISIVSEDQLIKSLPGTVTRSHRHHQRDIDERVDEMNKEQRGLMERKNQELKQRFQALQEAGGWQKAFLSQLALNRSELPGSTEQLNLAQQFIQNFVFCQQPLIAEQVSEFQASSTFGGEFPGSLNKEFVVEPLASIIINGCNFGANAGEVRVTLSQNANTVLTLQIRGWSDDSIFATLGPNPGIPDQEAQLVIVRNDGVESVPMTVNFFQHRVAKAFNVANNLNSVAVFTTAHTTQDQFRFETFPTGESDIAASHYTFCCSAVSGTDGWLFKLKNGWQIPSSPVFQVTAFDTGSYTPPGDFVLLSQDGISDCGIFSSGDGSVGQPSFANNPPGFPDYQSEVDIPWQAGSNCSGLVYFAHIAIVGPDGIPFE